MLEEFEFKQIVEPIMAWFRNNKRLLPWREDRDAYHIWVSEIMLQQTRVEAVIGYYQRFMKELPDVEALAQCEEDKLLKLWEGLGYYNRVRNMQCAAKTIMEEYQGKIPEEVETLLSLKGIGSYTARAIACQAFEKPVACVDGNVLRVITRLSRDNTDILKASFKKRVEQVLDAVVPIGKSGDFSQALMELGAIVCVPNGEPNCERCPLKTLCLAHLEHDEMKYPVKKSAKKRRVEKKTVFVLRKENKILLRKRKETGLLAGLYEFPNAEGHLSKKQCIEWVKKMNFSPLRVKEMDKAKHIFSHVEWDMIGYEIFLDEINENQEDGLFVDIKEAGDIYSIPAAFEKYKEKLNIISMTTKKS